MPITEKLPSIRGLFLSVVIPTYNRKASLMRTLDSLVNQTISMDRFEVIIVSDGSTDGTKEAVEKASFPFKIRFFEQSNSGPSVARNYGTRLACGKVIVFLDDDIEAVPAFLEEHDRAQEENAKLVVIGPQSMPPGEKFPVWIAWEHRMLEKQYEKFRSGEWSAGPNNLYSGNFSVYKEELIAVGGFDENFKRQEDVELGFRLSQNGLGFRFESRADGYHRPIRTYDSWLKTPYLYGVRDVQMARDKGEKSSIELAQKHYTERNLVTRICARVFVGRPILEPLLFSILRPAPIALDKIGLRRVGIGVLSLLFNLLYLQGMAKEIGGAGKMWRLLSVGASA